MMESGGYWHNIFDAVSDSSAARVESNMSTSASKLYSTKQVSLTVFGQEVYENTDKIGQMVAFIEKLVQSSITRKP